MNTMTMQAPGATRRPRRWPWVLGLSLLIMLALLATAWNGIAALPSVPVDITIDGERVVSGLDVAGMPPPHKVALVAVAAFSMLAALVLLPVALLAGLAALLVAALLIVGLPLLAVAAVLLIVLSPLWLLGWLVWKAVCG